MGIASAIGGFFKGSGVIKSIETVALEAIQTNSEDAEARALLLRTIDPNGVMRREISRFVCKAYAFYLAVAFGLIIMHFFGIGDSTAAKESLAAITTTFGPITTAFMAIVSASYGVNMTNNWKDVRNKQAGGSQ